MFVCFFLGCFLLFAKSRKSHGQGEGWRESCFLSVFDGGGVDRGPVQGLFLLFFFFSFVLWGCFFFFFLFFSLLVFPHPAGSGWVSTSGETKGQSSKGEFSLLHPQARGTLPSLPDVTYRLLRAHIWMFLLLLPKALAPTLVGTKLLLPMPPDRLRKSARRWVTQVAVLQARFCAVTLLQERKRGLIPSRTPQPTAAPQRSRPPLRPNHECLS